MTGSINVRIEVAIALNTFGVTKEEFVKECPLQCKDTKVRKYSWTSACCNTTAHQSCVKNMLRKGLKNCPLCCTPFHYKTSPWTKIDWASPECSLTPESFDSKAAEEAWTWTKVDWASPTCDPGSVSFDSDDEPAHAPWYSAGINMPSMMAEKLSKE